MIESFNSDKPYGQFIREQLAGDLLERANKDTWIATGFCRTGPSNESNVGLAELESYRMDQLDKILSTVSSAFLGQTLACARCHDHPTDPFTARDYYALLAFFRNTTSVFVPLEGDKVGTPAPMPILVRQAPKLPKGPGIRALEDLPSRDRKPTHILDRGDVGSPLEEVGEAVPAVLAGMPAVLRVDSLPARRALAEWIADPANALTWRVMANRVWHHLFGRGLVATPNDLGVSGAEPTHPDLLDHLAATLRDHHGRIKPLIRHIVLSRTFQQSSGHREDAFAVDPDNRLYWSFPIHRLEAEGIRDSILLASGTLNRERGGPGIKPRIPPEILRQSMRNTWPRIAREGPEHWRRSVYIYQKRQLPMPMMELLDVPDSSESCARRFSSTTPTQALALLNEEFVNEQARFAAERAQRERPEDPVRRLMELAWARTPGEDELAKGKTFLANKEVGLADLAVVLFNSSPFVYVD